MHETTIRLARDYESEDFGAVFEVDLVYDFGLPPTEWDPPEPPSFDWHDIRVVELATEMDDWRSASDILDPLAEKARNLLSDELSRGDLDEEVCLRAERNLIPD